MRATIAATGAFSYTAELRELAAPGGGYSFNIIRWAGAKDPAGEQTAFQACLDRAGLVALRDLITARVGA